VPTQLSGVLADITTLRVDAIVNAANAQLAGGGGVDGAIHRAAGPELLAACKKIGGCSTGQACITPGFDLPARYVIHAVGPVWRNGARGEPALLASCYRRSIEIAHAHALRSVAFSCISTGVYGYPFELATETAIATVKDALLSAPSIDTVIFCCFSAHDLAIYEALLRG
jgi:O-acetyl-ADP-ribose deacetylase (regulator of RNase III)